MDHGGRGWGVAFFNISSELYGTNETGLVIICIATSSCPVAENGLIFNTTLFRCPLKNCMCACVVFCGVFLHARENKK